MELFTRHIRCAAAGRPLVVVLHGFYSSSSSWYVLGRELGRRVGADCLLVDMPNHGHSPWVDEFNLRMVTGGVMECVMDQDLSCGVVIVGHSFGARVAMMLAEALEGRCGVGTVRGYVMIDMSPFVNHRTDRMISIWHAMLMERMAAARRAGVKNISAYLIEHKIDPELAHGMTLPYRQMNLEVMAHSVVALSSELRDAESPEFWSVVGGVRVLFLRGALSPYMPDLAVDKLEEHFTNYQLYTVQGGHHNLHQTHPGELLDTLESFYRSVLNE